MRRESLKRNPARENFLPELGFESESVLNSGSVWKCGGGAVIGVTTTGFTGSAGVAGVGVEVDPLGGGVGGTTLD